MLNRGLLIKSCRENWPALVMIAGAITIFEALLAYVLATFYEDFAGTLLQVDIIRSIFKGLIGTELGPETGPAFAALPWVHPVILALLWGYEIVLWSRHPAGEVDRGTIDVLFGMPVSRWQMFCSQTAVWLVSGLIIMVMAWLGGLWGGLYVDAQFRPPLDRLFVVVVNLYGVYLAVGALACLVSCLSNRQGRAMAIVFATVLISFLLNFLAQFWKPAEMLSFLGVLNYYRPALILQGDTWPIGNLIVLTLSATALWVTAGFIFARRDICTV